MDFVEDQFLWVEKYRPGAIKDCILPDRIKKQFSKIASINEIPNMILSGGPGTGKTTIAKALCNECNSDFLIINCSEETGIDTLRTKISRYASQSSIMAENKHKVLILDEFDYASPNLQAGLRNAFEKYSKTCSFILTCNYPNKIIDALFSRCVHITFDIKPDEKPVLCVEAMKRIFKILENEDVKYDKNAVVAVVKKYFPDMRRVLGTLNQFARMGSIDISAVDSIEDANTDVLIEAIKAKKFIEIKNWAASNVGNNLDVTYGRLYKKLLPEIKSNSIPSVILTLEEYQRYNSVVPDIELHIVALCVQLMAEAEFK